MRPNHDRIPWQGQPCCSQSREELRRLADQLVRLEERERFRLSVLLHDGVGQNLFALRTLTATLARTDDPEARARTLEEVRRLIDETMDQTRDLTKRLHPQVLHMEGLRAALVELAGELERRYGLVCHLHTGRLRLDLRREVQVLLYETLRELLMNVVKHARAEAAWVTLRHLPGGLQVTVEDDGIGLVGGRVKPAGPAGGHGLYSIRERLNLLGGDLEKGHSERSGASVRLFLPDSYLYGAGPREWNHDDQHPAGG